MTTIKFQNLRILNEKNIIELSGFSTFYAIAKTELFGRLSVLKRFKENNIDITLDQFAILYILTLEDGLCQREIGSIALKDRSNVTRMLDMLEYRDLIYREQDPESRRRYKVFITEKGQKKVEEVKPLMMLLDEIALKGLTVKELETLRNLLFKMCENLDPYVELQI